MTTTYPYSPDYVTPPGLTLEEVLDDLDMTQADLARRTDLTKKHINQIVLGRAKISSDTALKLERVTGVPARLWTNLESRYQEQLARIEESKRLNDDRELLSILPVGSMVSLGLLTRRLPELERLREILDFFGVANKKAWETTWSSHLASFRKSQVHDSSHGSLAVWLRLGELRSSGIECGRWDADTFRESLTEIRGLTKESDPSIWYPELVRRCATSGVALVVTPQVKGARVNGATRWLSPDRALIQMTLRHRWSDVFWFTFFHEAKHVLDEAKTSLILESSRTPDHDEAAEREADRFASDFLIPPREVQELRTLRSLASVRQFAERIDVHPGVVVGRLQHEKLWQPSHGNGLRQRLELSSDGSHNGSQ